MGLLQWQRNEELIGLWARGFCNVLCPADKNDEVAPSNYLDIAVSEDNDQREMFKKNQQQVENAKHHVETWPTRWDETWQAKTHSNWRHKESIADPE
jgi:hypothetical protein